VRVALTLLLLGPAAAVGVPPGPDPVPVDPYRALVRQFDERPLVAFLETHGSTEQHGFLRELVARPEFGRAVDAVVVEFGNARYQVTIDQYIRGERVPLSSLSRVWMRTTQTSGVWNDPIYREFFRAVRTANAGRPPDERIRVLLGDPPIDWRRIRTSWCPRRPRPTCLEYWIGRRTEHYASVVLDKVLARGQRALLIAGAFHLVRPPAERPWNETGIIERRHPGTVFTVKPHEAFGGPDAAELDRRLAAWPVPSLAVTGGTWLGALPPGVAFGAEPGDSHPLLSGRLEDRIDGYLVVGAAP
jgi:hypothetical protein